MTKPMKVPVNLQALQKIFEEHPYRDATFVENSRIAEFQQIHDALLEEYHKSCEQ